ncbi:MAG: hypothetical protein P8O16_20280 [Algoriphagus sp.]|uniref:hypothetical protein n=1 Tax=Algoriphagus sp. TaxID=1872435 RepID=UPI002605725B|nr:hypothetical protein [Algoriphagus sp.]MDG1279619.1 hypothetical protein [Algoriphagus sp.]
MISIKGEFTDSGLRIIYTARNSKEIRKAFQSGFYPLVKKVIPSTEIFTKYAVFQHKETGEVDFTSDYRSNHDEFWEQVIPWTNYYPYNFESPYAAYLLPKDLKVGERVLLADLIEDIVGSRWNQGSNYRLESCEAVWNGQDFEIDFDLKKDTSVMMG